jgi:hypothetical protein
MNSLALMEAVSFCAKKLIFPGRKERPKEAPFMALEKCFFAQKIQAYSRNSSFCKQCSEGQILLNKIIIFFETK